MSHSDFQPAAKPKRRSRRFGGVRAVLALIMREMATTYGRSPGGYIWAILEPAAAISLMTLVFSALVRSPSIGISFPMFYATGMLPFLLYVGLQAKVSGGLTYSRPLLAYPTVTYLDSLVARMLLELITKLLVSYIVLATILTIYETRVNFDFPTIFEAYGLAAFLGFGVGCLNCVIMTRFPVYQRFWAVLTAPMFILSGIIFIYEEIPTEYQPYLWYNPLLHITAMMRSGFYSTYRPDFISVPYVVGVSLVCLAMGLLLLRRYHRDLLNI